MNDPAFTTLAYVFALKAKNTDKAMTNATQTQLENELKRLFSLPSNLVRNNNQLDSLEWMNDFAIATNVDGLISAIKRIPTTGENQANDEIVRLIYDNLKPVILKDRQIKDLYRKGYSQPIVQPIVRLYDGFDVALDKFNAKKLKITRLNAIRADIKNMENRYNQLVNGLWEKLKTAYASRMAYTQQFQLLRRKLDRYEPPKARSPANKQNEDYDFDYLKMLQTVSLDLSVKIDPLIRDIISVKDEREAYIQQRVKWAESLLGIPFSSAPPKKSGFSCFGGSKVKP